MCVCTGRRPRRQLAQRGDVEVAVAQQRHRARDRRRGHVQDVRHEAVLRLARRSAARWRTPKRCCSSTTTDRQAIEHDVRPRPGHAFPPRRQLAGRELVQRVGAPRGRRRAGQQRHPHRLARHQRLQRGEVLLGQRLGRRHEHRLHVVLDRAQHRVQRDDGLARADLAHEQALHRPRRGELLVERRDRPRLVAGQRRTAAAPRASGGSATARRQAPAPRRWTGAARAGAAARAARAAARRRRDGDGRPRGRRRARPAAPPAGPGTRPAPAPAPAAARPRARRRPGARARARGSAWRTAPRLPGSGRPRSRCRSTRRSARGS